MGPPPTSSNPITVGLCLESGNDAAAWHEILDRLCPQHVLRIKTREHNGYGDLRDSVAQTIREFNDIRVDLIVVVADNDRRPPAERMTELRVACTPDTIDERVLTITVAIEAFEAWLLADEVAVSKVSGRTVRRLKQPERVKDPKSKLKEVTSFDSKRILYSQLLRSLAALMDLGQVSGKCKRFRKFRGDFDRSLRLSIPESGSRRRSP